MKTTRDYDIEGRLDADLVVYASHFENAMFGPDELMGRPAAEYDWELVDFPIAEIENAPEDWAAWMGDEIAMWADEGQPDRYATMFDRPIEEEVVLILEGGRGYMWDGYHRTGSSVIKGETTVRAAVGTLRPEYSIITPKGP